MCTYDGEMRKDPRHWWNRKWGRLSRLDVFLHRRPGPDGERWIVEAVEGGAEGRRRTWEPPDEKLALELVADLTGDADQNWVELSAIRQANPITP
jgi:hypothetical protein